MFSNVLGYLLKKKKFASKIEQFPQFIKEIDWKS